MTTLFDFYGRNKDKLRTFRVQAKPNPFILKIDVNTNFKDENRNLRFILKAINDNYELRHQVYYSMFNTLGLRSKGHEVERQRFKDTIHLILSGKVAGLVEEADLDLESLPNTKRYVLSQIVYSSNTIAKIVSSDNPVEVAFLSKTPPYGVQNNNVVVRDSISHYTELEKIGFYDLDLSNVYNFSFEYDKSGRQLSVYATPKKNILHLYINSVFLHLID